MSYNPDSIADRTDLATRLVAMLAEAGFTLVSSAGENIYERAIPQAPGVRVVVYSSIVGTAVRGDGKDAIRVGILYRRKDGSNRSLFNETRINRTGYASAIVQRTLTRMRSCFGEYRDRHNARMYCRCGAPLGISKIGKDYCADTCWV